MGTRTFFAENSPADSTTYLFCIVKPPHYSLDTFYPLECMKSRKQKWP